MRQHKERIALLLTIAGIMLVVLMTAAPASAQKLVVDVSNPLVSIRTDFTGADVTLFGATDGEGDVAIRIKGPDSSVTVREKKKVAGIYVNASSLTFKTVPGYYAVAANRPLEEITAPETLKQYELGFENLPFTLASADTETPEERLSEYLKALVRNKQSEKLYSAGLQEAVLMGNRLFRTQIKLPANTPTGNYNLDVFLFQDGKLVDAQTSVLVVSKVGWAAGLFEFATQRSLLYGLTALAGAIFAGWAAAAAFKES